MEKTEYFAALREVAQRPLADHPGVREHLAVLEQSDQVGFPGAQATQHGWAALGAWRRMGLTRYATHGLLERIWGLRDNLSAYDAGYVALAESLDCSLVTAEARISRAPGLRCSITVVPR